MATLSPREPGHTPGSELATDLTGDGLTGDGLRIARPEVDGGGVSLARAEVAIERATD